MAAMQNWPKTYYNSKMKSKIINVDDIVLLYDNQFQKFPSKFKLHWMGPYKVKIAHQNGSIK